MLPIEAPRANRKTLRTISQERNKVLIGALKNDYSSYADNNSLVGVSEVMFTTTQGYMQNPSLENLKESISHYVGAIETVIRDLNLDYKVQKLDGTQSFHIVCKGGVNGKFNGCCSPVGFMLLNSSNKPVVTICRSSEGGSHYNDDSSSIFTGSFSKTGMIFNISKDFLLTFYDKDYKSAISIVKLLSYWKEFSKRQANVNERFTNNYLFGVMENIFIMFLSEKCENLKDYSSGFAELCPYIRGSDVKIVVESMETISHNAPMEIALIPNSVTDILDRHHLNMAEDNLKAIMSEYVATLLKNDATFTGKFGPCAHKFANAMVSSNSDTKQILNKQLEKIDIILPVIEEMASVVEVDLDSLLSAFSNSSLLDEKKLGNQSE